MQAHQPGDPYCDVNGDGEVGPVDSLLVINYLNAGPEAEGESEFSEAVDQFRVGTLGQILPEGTAGAARVPLTARHGGQQFAGRNWEPVRLGIADLAVGANKPFQPVTSRGKTC